MHSLLSHTQLLVAKADLALKTAVFKMHTGNFGGRPVVDGHGKVVGYLVLFDTLLTWTSSMSPGEGGEA